MRTARLRLTRWRELVEQRRSFESESTLSGLTYASMLREAKDRGYVVNLCYLHLATVRHSIRRVRERVKNGGHDVPRADLHRRFLPSLRNFFQLYLPLADSALLYDATLLPPKLLAQWQVSKPTIHHTAEYEPVLAKIG